MKATENRLLHVSIAWRRKAVLPARWRPLAANSPARCGPIAKKAIGVSAKSYPVASPPLDLEGLTTPL